MSAAKNKFEGKSFREIMDEFEQTCARFDAAELDIEQALEYHKKASELLDELERRLKKAEADIKKAKA